MMTKIKNWKDKKRKIIFLEQEQIIRFEALKWQMKAESIYEVYETLLETGYKTYTRKEMRDGKNN